DDRVAFFSHVSHEFRTPLSVIIGFTEDLLKHLDLPRQAYSDLESVLSASIALASMVEDLLAFFSLERNKLTVAPKLVKSQESAWRWRGGCPRSSSSAPIASIR
ncbi:unnamed protein product, partial [Ascophyllum nodosum]